MKDEEKDKPISNRRRLLYLMEVLKKYTDGDHQYTIQEIIDLFYQETGINASRNGIREDLREFQMSNIFKVGSFQKSNGLERYYSYQDRLFEFHELRLLVDAISSAKFITTQDTEDLIAKIKKLTSIHQSKQLDNRLLLPDSAKTNNRFVKYTINDLHNAIMSKKIIEFKYGRYDVQKKFQLSNHGNYYKVKPYALVWNNDFYYLIGEFVPQGDIRHYRIDRIQNVRETGELFLPSPDFDVTKYISKLFHMYSGEEKSIEIEFDNHLINVVIDRFGINADIRPLDNNKFRLITKAVISEGLIRWLLTWGKDAKVLYPESLVEQIKSEAEKLYHLYHKPR